MDQLKQQKRWGGWRREEGRKVPYSVRGHRASTTNLEHWASYAEAVTMLTDEPDKWDGLAYLFANDGFAGVDLDDCRNPATGEIAEWARQIIAEANTYTEVSPSGTGIKLYCLGNVPESYNSKREDGSGIEAYSWGRYFCFTGEGDQSTPLRQIPERLRHKPESTATPAASGGRDAEYARLCEIVAAMPQSIQGQNGSGALIAIGHLIVRHGFIGPQGQELFEKYATECSTPAWPKAGAQGYDRKWKEVLKRAEDEGDAGRNITPPEFPIVANAASTNAAGPILVSFDQIEALELEWLWEDRVPAGCVSMISGRPGEGKSLITCDMAGRITTGRPFPDGRPSKLGEVIFITAEDDPAYVQKPRLIAAGADVSKVHSFRMVNRLDEKTKKIKQFPFSLEDVLHLEVALKLHPQCRLVVIDPIGSFLGGGRNGNSDNEVREALGPLGQVAEKYGCAVLMVTHTRKSTGDYADDMVIGSRAFTAFARAVWHLTTDPEDEDRRLFVPGKCNWSLPQSGLSFAIKGKPPSLLWDDKPVNMNANDVMFEKIANAKNRMSLSVKRDEAMDYLRDALAAGPRPSREVNTEARGQGISEKTLDRARKELGIVPVMMGDPCEYHMQLPYTPVTAPQDSGDAA